MAHPPLRGGRAYARGYRQPVLKGCLRTKPAAAHDPRMDAFDGAGRPYNGPSFGGGLAMLVAVIVGVALAWSIYSAALNVLDRHSPVQAPRQFDADGSVNQP
jgi:hypothetical protein